MDEEKIPSCSNSALINLEDGINEDVEHIFLLLETVWWGGWIYLQAV